MSADPKPTCFIAMPITTRQPEVDEFGDRDHWRHVMDALFVKAIREAGYTEIIPEARGSWLIHDRIITSLIEADMVLCDMSALNSNVFFELGVRTSLNKPIALVYDGRSDLSFDTSGINTYKYRVPLEYWSMESQISDLSQHIKDCATSCAGENPLWRQFGLKIAAERPTTSDSPLEAKVDLLLNRISRVDRMQDEIAMLHRELSIRSHSEELRDRQAAVDRSKADGNAGIAAEAIVRYATSEHLAIGASVASGGRVVVTVDPAEIAPRQLTRIDELGSRYGVQVRFMSSQESAQGPLSTEPRKPSPAEFLEGHGHGTDDDQID